MYIQDFVIKKCSEINVVSIMPLFISHFVVVLYILLEFKQVTLFITLLSLIYTSVKTSGNNIVFSKVMQNCVCMCMFGCGY